MTLVALDNVSVPVVLEDPDPDTEFFEVKVHKDALPDYLADQFCTAAGNQSPNAAHFIRNSGTQALLLALVTCFRSLAALTIFWATLVVLLGIYSSVRAFVWT